MNKQDWLAEQFEATRHHLKAVAYRMLGSSGEAEDAVQETWLRLSRSDSEQIENLAGWLTTVLSRVCLDMLRSRKTRREESFDKNLHELADEDTQNPETDLFIADSVGQALLIVLDTLTPAERIAFVLHDLFDMPFDKIAPIIDRTATATRQLASRARRRVRGADSPQEDIGRQQEMVSAFLTASREGNFDALIGLLHPDIILRADETAVNVAKANQAAGAPQFKHEILGPENVADTFKGKAAAAQLALIDGAVGATWAPKGKPVIAFCFSVIEDKIAAIDIIMDKHRLRDINIKLLDVGNGVKP